MDLPKDPPDIGSKEAPEDASLTLNPIDITEPEPAGHEPKEFKHIPEEVCVYDVYHLVFTPAIPCSTNKEIGETKI